MHLLPGQPEPADPLRNGDATAIRHLLMQQAESIQVAYRGEWFGDHAARLLTAMAPVLAWMRDHQAIRLTNGVVGYAMQLRAIASLATRRVFLAQAGGAGWISELPAREMPETLVYPLNAYLKELPGYDTTQNFEDQRCDEARRHHSMVLFLLLPFCSTGGRPT